MAVNGCAPGILGGSMTVPLHRRSQEGHDRVGRQNIYPADIEVVMRAHDAVAEVAVVGIPSARWGETPLAVVCCAPGAACLRPS